MPSISSLWRSHIHPLTQRLSKRQFLSGTAALLTAVGFNRGAKADGHEGSYDVIVIGGGTAGLPTAIFAAQRGARVLVIEAAASIGGTLFLSSAQMSAAGTKLQKSKGITEDSWQSHYDDVMRISNNTADPDILRLATQNAAAAFDWLMDNGLEVYPEHPVTGTTHEPYSHARYAWSPKWGLGVLEIFERLLQPHVDNGLVVLKTSTEAKDLLTNERGDVIGVSTLDADGKAEKFMGKNVVLTSGGYASNAQMFEELEGAIDYSDVSYPYSQGAGIKLGQSVGGYVRYGENHLPLWGAILADDDFPSPMAAVARHFPGDRPPWEIIINAEGKRILKEDVLSHAVYEEVLVEQPGEQCWAVWDQKINDEAPRYIMTGFGTMAAEDVPDAFNEGWTNFYKADTLDELATKMGISVSGLAETVEKYNRSVETGVDEDFGRTHMPLPIEQGPFYGIHMRSWFLTTTAGLAVNKDLQLITQEGKPIGNLYAAGEILGTGATSGRAICGGMLVTPAIAFGKLLGERILQFDI